MQSGIKMGVKAMSQRMRLPGVHVLRVEKTQELQEIPSVTNPQRRERLPPGQELQEANRSALN